MKKQINQLYELTSKLIQELELTRDHTPDKFLKHDQKKLAVFNKIWDMIRTLPDFEEPYIFDDIPPFHYSNEERIALIKQLMNEWKVRQVDLSKITGQSESYISRLLSGRDNISDVMFAAIYNFFESLSLGKIT